MGQDHPDTESIEECVDVEKNRKKYMCSYEGCNAVFVRPHRLASHIRVHTGEKPFKCSHPGCDKAYGNNSHLKRHMATHSSIATKLKCPHCPLEFRNRQNVQRHFNHVHKDPSKLTCPYCSAVFSKKFQLRQHINWHQDICYKCETCDKTFYDVTKFRRHKSYHVQEKKYSCEVSGCNEVFRTQSQFSEHTRMKHPSTYKCKDCNKIFYFKYHLRKHALIHSEDRPVFDCPYENCHRHYLFEKNLISHVNVYHLKTKFECDICKQRKYSKSRLASHIQKMHMGMKKVAKQKKKQRKRKDAGKPKKSMVSHLVGIKLPADVEKDLLERETTIQFDPDKSSYLVKKDLLS